MIAAGHRFRIAWPGHWGHEKTFTATDRRRVEHNGVDLGMMVEYQAPDWLGRPTKHLVAESWCEGLGPVPVAETAESAQLDLFG